MRLQLWVATSMVILMNPYFSFQISLVANNLNLAIDSNNPTAGQPLTIQNANISNPDQVWTWMYLPAFNGSVLYNVKRNLVAAPRDVGQGSLIYLYDANGFQFSSSSTWNISGTVIRVAGNTDLNMNAFGSGSWPANTQVGLWEWKGSKENMEWNITRIS